MATFDIGPDLKNRWVVLRGDALTQHVNRWLRDAGTNHGLTLDAGENIGGPSIKYFSTPNAEDPSHRPRLLISYDGEIDIAALDLADDHEIDLRRSLAPYARMTQALDAHADRLSSSTLEKLTLFKQACEARPADLVLIGRAAEGLWALGMNDLWPGTGFAVWNLNPWDARHR